MLWIDSKTGEGGIAKQVAIVDIPLHSKSGSRRQNVIIFDGFL